MSDIDLQTKEFINELTTENQQLRAENQRIKAELKPWDGSFETWWLVNKYKLIQDENVGIREIAKAAWDAVRTIKSLTTCVWQEKGNQEETVWETSCGQTFVILDGEAPGENDMKYCCYCGKVLFEKPAEEMDEE